MKKLMFLILTMLIISVMALSCFTVSAFDIVITPTVACLAVIGTLITATGIYYASDADFQKACEIAWYQTTDNVRSWCANVAETWDGINTINASMGQLLYAEWLQWLDGFSAKYNYTNISTLSECPVVNLPLTDLSVYDYGFLAYYPRNFGTQILYIGTTKLIITQESSANYIEYVFPNDVRIKFRYPYGYDTTYTTGYNIGVPIIQTMNGYNEYIHYIARTRSGGLANSSNKPNMYYINNTQITLSNGRVKSYSSNIYYSPEGLIYNSLEEFIYYYVLTWGQNISMQYDANANTKAKALPQTLEPDEDVSVVVAPSVPEIRAMSQVDSLPQTGTMEYPIPTTVPTTVPTAIPTATPSVITGEYTGVLSDISTKVGELYTSLTAPITASIVSVFNPLIEPFQTELMPIFNHFQDFILDMEYNPFVFEDIYVDNLYGERRVVVKLSLINDYIPTARIWFASIFWFFYACYVFDSVYFLIRGTHALNSSIARSEISAAQEELRNMRWRKPL